MTTPFVDTNVVVYSLDAADPRKQAVAREVLASRPRPRISPQVLRETYSVAVAKLDVDRSVAAEMIGSMLPHVAIVEDAALVEAAVRCVDRWQISIWDALIVEGARRAGCDLLLSEDLQDGMDFDGVVVQNPFAA